MKILFKVIRTGSGNDMYFERLSQALSSVGIASEIRYYNKLFQFAPFLLKFYNSNNDADIIHSNVEYGWAVKEDGKKLVVSVFHNVFEYEYQKYTSFLQKIYHYLILKPNIILSLKTADKIIAISKYSKNSFSKDFNIQNISVIYPLIDTDKYIPKKIKHNKKYFRLLYIGNLTKRKGFDLLPQIMKELGCRYKLYFTFGLRRNFIKNLKNLNFIALGKLSEKNLINEINKCDALICPSRLEGFGYSVVEAMSCGKTVFISKSSSLPELVKDGKTGIICLNVQDFINKIHKYSYNPKTFSLNPKLIRSSTVNNFSYNSLIKKYLAEYNALF